MIELDNVTKIYHMGKVEVPALKGVSLEEYAKSHVELATALETWKA